MTMTNARSVFISLYPPVDNLGVDFSSQGQLPAGKQAIFQQTYEAESFSQLTFNLFHHPRRAS